MHPVPTVTVPAAEYERLRAAAETPARLETAGVNNREGHDIALREE